MKKTFKTICLFLLMSSLIFASGSSEPKPKIANNIQNSNTVESPLDHISPTTTEIPTIQNVEEDKNTTKLDENIRTNLNSLYSIYSLINTYSINELDQNKAFDEQASALVNALGDKYSVYIAKDEMQDFEELNLGTYSGIGSYILKQNPKNINSEDPETYMIKIESPFPDGPSDRAGLKANDLISAIDGESVNALTGTEASNKLKGKEGTSVTLTINRGNQVFDISLKRELVKVPSVVYDIVNNHIGYLRINQFIIGTDVDVATAIQNMLNQGMESLIIDLRNNGGGLVTDATNIANLFLNGQKILTTQSKKTLKENIKITLSSKDTLVPMDFPLVVIVNGGTASSSEILTGALQDNKRATVIGNQTFGKGVMQQLYSIKDAIIKLTIAHYYTPNGTDINKIGITPDVLVKDHELSDEEIKQYETIMNENLISNYVDKNPKYTKENVENFVKTFDEKDVYKPFLYSLVRNEYLYRMDYNDRPKFDINYDEYLKTAVEYLDKQ
ncbi:MAG: S41 family peptidase [Spirochaetaceae bacterium]|nr:S41 family peptidase [Spirochaetaceae bacterium]